MRNTATRTKWVFVCVLLSTSPFAWGYEWIVESRAGGKNYASYSDVSMFNSGVKSAALGCTAGIGCRYSNNTTCRATYTFVCPETGTYQVDVTWALSTYGDASVLHAVAYDGGTFTRNMNMHQAGGGGMMWNTLGSFGYTAGQTYTVVQTNPTLEGIPPQRMMADAVRWVKIDHCSDVPAVAVQTDPPPLPGDSAVTVLGVSTSPPATLVKIYANGVLIGSRVPATSTVTVPVDVDPAVPGYQGLLAGMRVHSTQIVNGLEGCLWGNEVAVGSCESVHPVSVDGVLLSGDTEVPVKGIGTNISRVRVYADGFEIGSLAPPRGQARISVPVIPLVSGATIKATQSYGVVEGCMPTSGPQVDNCNQVPPLPVIAAMVNAGATLVRVTGVSSNATQVKVYANDGDSDRLIGSGLPVSPITIITVSPLVEGEIIKAVQTNRIDGCMPSRGQQVMAANVIEDFEGTVRISNDPDAVTGGEYSTWYDAASNAFTDVLGPADVNRGRLFGSRCINITDHGWINGAYIIYEKAIPTAGTYHLALEMLIDEPEGLDYDFYRTYQVGVVVNGQHRTASTVLPPITSCIGSYACLTPLRDGVNETAPQTVYTGAFTASAGDDLLIGFSTDVTSYDARKTATPTGYVGMKIDNIRLVSGPKPPQCTDVIAPRIIATAAAPLEAGGMVVNVAGIDPMASEVKVYADGVVIGTGVPAGLAELDSPVSRLIAGQVLWASQVVNGMESCICPGATGPVVGTGSNSPIKIAIGVRETGSTSGTIGSNGGNTGPIEWIGASTAVSGAPQGKSLRPASGWQTVTFSSPRSGGTDPVLSFNAGNGTIDGAYGTLEHIAFSIGAPYNSGRYTIKVDSIYNGTISLCNFDDLVAFPSQSVAMFRAPSVSATTMQHLMQFPNVAMVDSMGGADGSAQCYRFEFQFLDGQPKRWVRLTTVDDTSTPDMPLQNPLIDLSQPITMKVQLLSNCGPLDGDLDADGDVDAADFRLFADSFGHNSQNPEFKPCADYDFDGGITFIDYQQWLAAYRAFTGQVQGSAPLEVLGDFQRDGHVDTIDFAHFSACANGPEVGGLSPECANADLDGDGDADQEDFGILQRCLTGPDQPIELGCR